MSVKRNQRHTAIVDKRGSETRVIPLASQEAETWNADANQDKVQVFQNQTDPTERNNMGKQNKQHPKMLDKEERVTPHKKGWAV